MIVSTKGRYALRVLVDLAERDDAIATLDNISDRQGISEKYLEVIASLLVRGGLIKGRRGKGGGYYLAVDPEKCTVGKVLKLTEGSLAPVACLSGSENVCPRASKCSTVAMWQKLDNLIDGFFEGITLADLMENGKK